MNVDEGGRREAERAAVRPREAIRMDLDRPVLKGYRRALRLIALYLLLLIPYYLLGEAHGYTMGIVNLCAGVTLLVVASSLRPERSEWLILLGVLTVVAQVLIHLALNRTLFLTSDLMLIVVAASLLFRRWWAYLAMLGVAAAAWSTMLLLGWTVGERAHWTLGMISALLAGLVLHTYHQIVTKAQEDLRLKDRERYEEQVRLVARLEEALENVQTLRGLVPICAHCKKIRDDSGFWQQVESYVSSHSGAEFTHSICPECEVKVLQELGDVAASRRT